MSRASGDSVTAHRMSRQRQYDTKPERAVRDALRSLGIRYRAQSRLPGTPDIANKTQKCALFGHSCFWHHHPGCSKATVPKPNTAWWRRKFQANTRRDIAYAMELKSKGFDVLVVWECQVSRWEVLLRRLRRWHEAMVIRRQKRLVRT